MSVTRDHLQHAYTILAERESTRLAYSQPRQIVRYPTPQHVFYSVANSAKYKASNRYSNIYAYDRTAVKVDGEGYLNANVVCDGRGMWWVASQAPVPGAFYAFFRAIFTRAASSSSALPIKDHSSHSRVAILVQLTGWEENGIAKADRYIPQPGAEATYTSNDSSNAIKITSHYQVRLSELSSTLTELRVYAPPSKDEEAMTVYHYHFDAWPDHGVPDGHTVQSLRALIIEISRRRDELGGANACEFWTHCSAGIGRTGTFIALSSLLTSSGLKERIESPLGSLPSDLEDDVVAQTVDQLREWRGMLVQGPDQLRLIYQLVGAKRS